MTLNLENVPSVNSDNFDATDLRSGVNRGMQIPRSMVFFARSVDPPKFLFESENTTTLVNRSVKVQR